VCHPIVYIYDNTPFAVGCTDFWDTDRLATYHNDTSADISALKLKSADRAATACYNRFAILNARNTLDILPTGYKPVECIC
jgi:hypothetical protein